MVSESCIVKCNCIFFLGYNKGALSLAAFHNPWYQASMGTVCPHTHAQTHLYIAVSPVLVFTKLPVLCPYKYPVLISIRMSRLNLTRIGVELFTNKAFQVLIKTCRSSFTYNLKHENVELAVIQFQFLNNLMQWYHGIIRFYEHCFSLQYDCKILSPPYFFKLVLLFKKH